jgi:hypothetical protein
MLSNIYNNICRVAFTRNAIIKEFFPKIGLITEVANINYLAFDFKRT